MTLLELLEERQQIIDGLLKTLEHDRLAREAEADARNKMFDAMQNYIDELPGLIAEVIA